ncbi:MAG: hypothetical protein QOG04_2169 [Actinomycetota bacterium]|nr:hypothetical protein [Actinomycetota bacterium]
MVSLGFVLTACGSPQSATPSPSAAKDDLLYRCSGDPFDPEALEGSGSLEKDDSPLGEALRRLFESSEGDLLAREDGWRVVGETSDEVQVMAPRDGEWFVSARFTKEGDRYITGGFGDCRPTAVLGSRSPMTWELADSVGRDSDTISVLATEIECASARSPAPEQIDAHVTYSEEEVSVLVYVDEIVGGECPGNPPVPFTVELSEPIGDRAVLDAARYPPRKRHP